MARAARQRRENELPYIPFGPFQIRFPFIHYKIESVEFIQGLILGVTALAAVPYLEQYLGLPYELAWSCVIIETMLYMLHSLLGDPVVPGWITPTLPLTIVFLEGFPMGKERIQAMIALQMLVGLVFIFMGITKLADKFVHAVPNSVKGGILLAAPVTVMAGQLGEGGNMHKYPLAIVAGVGLLILISFSDKYQEKRKNNKSWILLQGMEIFFPISDRHGGRSSCRRAGCARFGTGNLYQDPAVQRDHLTGKYLWCGNPAGLHVCQSASAGACMLCYRIW